MEKLLFKNNASNITTAFVAVVMLFLFLSCSKEKINSVPSFDDRADFPMLRTTDVTAMISDSGITRYRIKAPVWAIYDMAEEPYWDFPQGIEFERFDSIYQTDADIVSDKAIYYEKKKFWILTGNVNAMNLQGEKFKSDTLYWDQNEGRIYAPDSIMIVQADNIIFAHGFESDQTLSKYKMRKVTGIIPIDDEAMAVDDETFDEEPQ